MSDPGYFSVLRVLRELVQKVSEIQGDRIQENLAISLVIGRDLGDDSVIPSTE